MEWRLVAFLHEQSIREYGAFTVIAIGVKIDLVAILGNVVAAKAH
jgi:hypothetical protein